MKKFELSRKPGATTETNISNDSEQVNTQENKGTELVRVILKLPTQEPWRKLQPVFQESPELELEWFYWIS